MRAILVVSLVALLCPAAALAQTAPAPSTAPLPAAEPSAAPATPHAARARGGDITKAEYIERAVERAKRAAEKRFDKMDTNHDGVLSAEERGAARAARSKRKSSPE